MKSNKKKNMYKTLVITIGVLIVLNISVLAQSNWNVDKEWLDKAKISTQSVRLTSTNWWDEADKIVWIFSDSQPKISTDFQRMNQCANDLNSLPFDADYCIGAGDITNCENTGDINNIDDTFDSLNRINWFKANESDGGLIVPGNHDQKFWQHYNEVFNGDWNNWDVNNLDYLYNISFGNFIFYGLIPVNSRPPNNFVPALNQLRAELQRFDDKNIEKNVIIVYHYPAGDHYGFNWRLHNCGNSMQPHKTCMNTASNNSLFNILDVWGEKYIVACFSGHVHQDWRHSGCQCVVQHNDTYFLNCGQFGDGGGGACGESVKVGFSMFMSIVNGSSNVSFYKRNSFLEHEPFNAVNEITPYWMYDCNCTAQVLGNLTIPLEYSAIVDNDNQTPFNWWNDDWNYYKICYITNSTNNYQMKINVTYSSGGDINCSEHCQLDFDDIRFIDVDNSTILNYWLEEKVDGNYAIFWVKPLNDKVLMYYGNNTAFSISNGEATFVEFNTFENTLDGWSDISLGNGYLTWDNIIDNIPDGVYALKFVAEDSSSNKDHGKVCKDELNRNKDTYLQFYWRLENGLNQLANRIKDENDYNGPSYRFSNNNLEVKENAGNWIDHGDFVANKWYKVKLYYNYSTKEYNLIISPDVCNKWFESNTLSFDKTFDEINFIGVEATSNYHYYLDEVFVSEWTSGIPPSWYDFSDENSQDINIPPTADFTYSPDPASNLINISFIDQSYDPDGYIVNWSWSFGDGGTSYEQNPIHIYQTPAEYQVSLTIEDNGGYIQLDSLIISVYQTRGDVNGDNKIDINDVNYLSDYLFNNGPPPLPCC